MDEWLHAWMNQWGSKGVDMGERSFFFLFAFLFLSFHSIPYVYMYVTLFCAS